MSVQLRPSLLAHLYPLHKSNILLQVPLFFAILEAQNKWPSLCLVIVEFKCTCHDDVSLTLWLIVLAAECKFFSFLPRLTMPIRNQSELRNSPYILYHPSFLQESAVPSPMAPLCTDDNTDTATQHKPQWAPWDLAQADWHPLPPHFQHRQPIK